MDAVLYTHRGDNPENKEVHTMRNIDKEITVNGKCALLYGFDWSRGKVIYRIAHDGGIAEYVEIDI